MVRVGRAQWRSQGSTGEAGNAREWPTPSNKKIRGRGFAPDAPLTVGDVRTTASQFLFYGEYSYAQTGGF